MTPTRITLYIVFFLRIVTGISVSTGELNDDSGVVFNFKKQVLIAEKFVNVRFLVPYPILNASFAEFLTNISSRLDKLWIIENKKCNLMYTNKNEIKLGDDTLLMTTMREYTEANRDIDNLKQDIQSFLEPTKDGEFESSYSREKRALPLLLAASAGNLGLAAGLGSKLGCAISGIFGSCTDKAQVNEKNIDKAFHNMELMQQDWASIQNDNNEKFFLIASELKNVRSVQEKLKKIKNSHWNKTVEAFRTLDRTISRTT